MFEFEGLLGQISEREISETGFLELAKNNDEGVVDFFNTFALELARQYLSGDIPYEVGDDIANWLFGVLLHDSLLSLDGYAVPSPAYDIFLAFDAGEYRHREDTLDIDPVSQYTNKKLEAILNEEV